MNDLEVNLRTVIRELAAEGRPVPLGERALAGVRRRRRRTGLVTGLAAVAVVVSVLGPQWLGREGSPDVASPGGPTSSASVGPRPAPSSTVDPWPSFTGLGRAPVAPGGLNGDRLVVAAYGTTARGPGMFILNPATGRYRASGLTSVRAVSPDLRFALVTRHHNVSDEAGSGPIMISEYGIYDTVGGRVLGRLDVEAWVDPMIGRVVGGASWSPDGRLLVLPVRRGITGRGWLAERLLLVDVETGAIRAVDIGSSNGLEPLDLLGWTVDSAAVVLTADRAGTDEAPRGHVVYDLTGRPVAAHPWPEQSNPVAAIGADEVALVPYIGGEITVMDLRTGVIRHRIPVSRVSAASGWQAPLAWRAGEFVVRAEECTPAACTEGRLVLGVDTARGQIRALHTLDESVPLIVLAPAPAMNGPVAPLSW